MASIDDVRELMRLAVVYRLDGLRLMLRFSAIEIAAAYNGVGPEWFPAWARRILDNICKILLPAILIHDVRFTFSDGSVEQFVAANDELRANCRRIADAKYRWWQIRRYILRHRGEVIYRLCRDFGWRAYEAAYLKQENNNNENKE